MKVEGEIADALVDHSFESLAAIDETLIRLDGNPDKSRLGANSATGVSMAAAARRQRRTAFRCIGGWRPTACRRVFQSRIST